MIKIKIFTDRNLFELEDRVNEWLASNADINYRDIKYNIEDDGYHNIIIIYQIEK